MPRPSPRSTPLPDPVTQVRQALDQERATVARLEAEKAAADQAEAMALEEADTEALVSARTRALGVSDALARRRLRVEELEAQLASLQTASAERAKRERIVTLGTESRAEKDAWDGDLVETATRHKADYDRLAARQRELFNRQHEAFALFHRLLGVDLHNADSVKTRKSAESLAAELRDNGC